MSSLSEPSPSILITQIKLHTSKRDKIRYFRISINGRVKDKSGSVNTRRDGAYLAVYPSLIRPDAEEMIALSLPLPLPHRGAFIQVSGEVGLYAGGGRCGPCIGPQPVKLSHSACSITSRSSRPSPQAPVFPVCPASLPVILRNGSLPGGRSS